MDCSIARCPNTGKHLFITKLGLKLKVCDYHRDLKNERDKEDARKRLQMS